jgi:hypothetical protein
MKKGILLLPLVSFLSSCVPSMTREQQLAIYRTRCLDYGYQGGTREFADCMKEQDLNAEKNALQERKIQALETQNAIAQRQLNSAENLAKKDKNPSNPLFSIPLGSFSSTP